MGGGGGFSPRERRQSVIKFFLSSNFGQTKAAELARMKVGRSNKTVHKFHCELTRSPSEHRRSDAYLMYSVISLPKQITPAQETVTLETFRTISEMLNTLICLLTWSVFQVELTCIY